MQSVIVAGGIGSRIKKYVGDIPKSLIPIQSKLFLDLQLQWLSSSKQIHLCLGYKSQDIIEFVSSKEYDIKINWSVEREPLGVLGGIYHAKDNLNDVFSVVLGDALPQFPFEKLVNSAKPLLTMGYSVMFVAPSKNIPGQKGNVDIKGDMVKTYCKKTNYNGPCVDIGFWILQRKHILKYAKIATEEDFFNSVIKEGKLANVFLQKGAWEVGSIEGLTNMVVEIESVENIVSTNGGHNV